MPVLGRSFRQPFRPAHPVTRRPHGVGAAAGPVRAIRSSPVARSGEEVAAGQGLFGFNFVGIRSRWCPCSLRTGEWTGGGARRACGGLPGGQAEAAPADVRHEVVPAPGGAVVVGPGDVRGQVLVGGVVPGDAVGLLGNLVPGGAGKRCEQEVLPGRLKPLQDGDGAGHRGGDDRSLVSLRGLALEGQAVRVVAVDAPDGVALDGDAGAAQVLGYWRRGYSDRAPFPLQPVASSRWLYAASQTTVAGVSRTVTLAWLSWKLWSETRVSLAVDWNSGRVVEPQDTIVVLSLAMVRASPSLRSPA